MSRAHSTNNNKIESSPVFFLYDTKINKPNANQLSLETYAKKKTASAGKKSVVFDVTNKLKWVYSSSSSSLSKRRRKKNVKKLPRECSSWNKSNWKCMTIQLQMDLCCYFSRSQPFCGSKMLTFFPTNLKEKLNYTLPPPLSPLWRSPQTHFKDNFHLIVARIEKIVRFQTKMPKKKSIKCISVENYVIYAKRKSATQKAVAASLSIFGWLII